MITQPHRYLRHSIIYNLLGPNFADWLSGQDFALVSYNLHNRPARILPLFEQMEFLGMFNITVASKIAESEL
jgi:hypothetical protein